MRLLALQTAFLWAWMVACGVTQKALLQTPDHLRCAGPSRTSSALAESEVVQNIGKSQP